MKATPPLSRTKKRCTTSSRRS